MNIIVAIIALGLLIVLHEAGHFFVARWCGMRVYEFSIGFGPRIWHTKRGETEYSLRIVFLGGYVRVAGMHPAEEDAYDEGSFLSSAPWKRFLMIAAGPVANYLTAIALFIAIFGGWGTRDAQILVTNVKSGSSVASAGLQSGDRLLAIDGKTIQDTAPNTPLYSFDALVQEHYKKGLVMSILRKGQIYKVTFPKLDTKKAKSLGLKASDARIGFVKSVVPGRLAAKAGLQVGDQLQTINKKNVSDPFVFLRMAGTLAEKGFTLQVIRNKKPVTLAWPKSKVGTSPGVAFREVRRMEVAEVKAESYAQAAGLLVGDQILRINGTALADELARSAYQQTMAVLASCHTRKKPLKLKVLRGGAEKELSLKPGKEACAAAVTLRPTMWVDVLKPTKGSTAVAVGLKTGDRLLAIDGRTLGGFYHLLEELRRRIYKPIKVKILRDGKELSIKVPMAKTIDDWKLGFRPQLDFPRQRSSFPEACQSAVIATWRWNVRIWDSFKKLFTDRSKLNFTGPVGIVQMAQQTVKQGFHYFLTFVAVISIHLAFFNLLPIPALDGGRLMFLFTQQLLRLFGGREELGVRIEMIANLLGFFLLLGLLLFITFKDVMRLLKGFFGEG